MPIYTNRTKCQNYLKCKCKRGRLHPTEPIGISGFYAPFYKKIVTVHPNQEQWKDIIRQMDVQEIVLSEGDQKSVLRKTQRQLDEYITWEVFRRDEYTCRYCGINDVPMSYDHIKLWEKGGPNTVENGVCACKKCNKTRGNIEYKEWINSDYYKEKCQNVHPKFQKMNLELVCVYESFPNRISKKSR